MHSETLKFENQYSVCVFIHYGEFNLKMLIFLVQKHVLHRGTSFDK